MNKQNADFIRIFNIKISNAPNQANSSFTYIVFWFIINIFDYNNKTETEKKNPFTVIKIIKGGSWPYENHSLRRYSLRFRIDN